jgi:5-oxopent-3-ene-1,2,5-tricarboxylate decarboxylase/2-hydroxyhepta-2,4-diene-1,7-dioate isomerase
MDAQPTAGAARRRCATVYGVLLNDQASWQRMEAAFQAPPYHAAPRAPVLYLKPGNTHAADGATVHIPADPGQVLVNASIGLVLSRAATRLRADDALACVGAHLIASDLALPHASVYRPALRQRCRDGFLPMGLPVRADTRFDYARAEAVTFLNGVEVERRGFAQLRRPPAQLLADVTEFMTLDRGDVLLLGANDTAVLARPGDAVRIEIAGLGQLAYRVALDDAEEDVT